MKETENKTDKNDENFEKEDYEKLENLAKNNEKIEKNQEKVQFLSENNNIFDLMPILSQSLPVENFDFSPPPPRQKFFVPQLNDRLLIRKIYIEMLRAIRGYGELEAIAPQDDKQTILNLRNQMEVLSLAMLNLYGRQTQKNNVPFFSGGGINLSRNYQVALQKMYDKVFHIHNLVFHLIGKTTNNQDNMALIIVYTNLKSQLKTLADLKNGD